LDDLLCCDTKGDKDTRGNEEGIEKKGDKEGMDIREEDRDRGEMEIH
jgi:hypothetical protein